MAENPTDRSSRAATPGIFVGADDVRLEEIVCSLDLPFSEVRAPLQLALLGERALHRAAVHRAVSIDEAEAARLLYENFDDRFGASKIELSPPFLVGRDDGERAYAVRANRDFLFAADLVLAP